MNKTLTEDEESLNDFKHALISLCCAIIPIVGIFFFIMKGGTDNMIMGIMHILIGGMATSFCLYDWVIQPMRNRK